MNEGLRWEYLIRPLAHMGGNINAYLNVLGAEGWELVAIDEGIAYFKRPQLGG